MSLKILQLGPYPPPEGGVSRNIAAIRDRLIDGGDRCNVIATSRSSGSDAVDGIFRPGSPFELIKLLRRVDHDVLHLHIGGEISTRVLALMFACTVFGRRRVLTIHSGNYPESKAGRKASRYSIRGMILSRFDRLIAINDQFEKLFERYGIADNSVCKIVPFAPTLPDPTVAIPADIKNFAASAGPLILSVGGMEQEYDPLFQIAAFGEVLKQKSDARLIMAGGGSMYDEVREVVDRCGYGDKIILAGNIDHAVTLHLIANADALIRTTLYDGDAISVREAIFLNTPVIATDNGMRPNGTILFPQGDVAAFTAEVVSAVDSAAERTPPRSADLSNIDKVIELYRSLS